MSPAQPPVRLIRSNKLTVAIYGFGNASGLGFGSSFFLPTQSILFCYGMWGRDSELASSNYYELAILVDAIEAGLRSGNLAHSELFLFADNFTAKAAYYQGNLDSKALFNIVLCLRLIDCYHLTLHLVHVAGTRMIQQGTDGLSRGYLSSGVMAGTLLLSYIPLYLNAFEQLSTLLSWVHSWAPTSNLQCLEPADWYELGHGLAGGEVSSQGVWMPNESSQGWFLWAPPPSAVLATLDELSLSGHKHIHLNHIFLCLCLLTHLWQKHLHKVADIVIELPAGYDPSWPASCH